MNHIEISPDIVMKVKSAFIRCNTLKKFYITFIDDADRKEHFMSDLINAKFEYDKITRFMLKEYNLSDSVQWALNFHTGVLTYGE